MHAGRVNFYFVYTLIVDDTIKNALKESNIKHNIVR